MSLVETSQGTPEQEATGVVIYIADDDSSDARGIELPDSNLVLLRLRPHFRIVNNLSSIKLGPVSAAGCDFKLRDIAISVKTSNTANSFPVALSTSEAWGGALYAKATQEWAPIQQRVATFAELEDGWDDCDGEAPTREMVIAFQEVIARLKRLDAPLASEAFVAGDGEIGLRWRDAKSYASLSFLKDGSMLAYVRGVGLSRPYSLDTEWAGCPSVVSFVQALKQR